LTCGLHLVRARAFRGKAQPHPCSPLSGNLFGSIAELDASAVVLEYPSHYREAEAGALLARGDIGFEQTAPVLLRQSDPVIDHIDDDVLAFGSGPYADASATELCGRHGGDGFGCVLDDVGECLGD
jgi:hypothetical protein